MKTQNQISILSILYLSAILMLTVTACEGPTGAQGVAGPGGPAGKDGNANVVTEIVTLTDSDWEDGVFAFQRPGGGSTSRTARVATLDVPQITENINDFGIVLVYFRTITVLGGTPSQWISLPYHFLAFGSAYFFNINYSYDTGELRFYFYFERNLSSGTVPNVRDAEIPDYSFKYVIASGNAISSMSKMGVNIENHDEVMSYLNTHKHFKVYQSPESPK